MTDNPNPPRNQLAEEAADWFARMRGPDAETSREAFERWLASGALHRAAYNRVAEVFAMGKLLKDEHHAIEPRRRYRSAPALLAAMAIILALALSWWSMPAPKLPTPGETGIALGQGIIESPTGDIRAFRMADGSTVTLDTGSRVAFAFDGARRDFRLLEGRARFTVAHERRPFLVHAGTGTIIAHGTIFDVRMTDAGSVAVRLIQGKVDVRLENTRPRKAAIRRLAPGDALLFRSDFAPYPAPADGKDWPAGMLEAKAMSISELLAEANRYGGSELVAGSEKIAMLQVTGRFSVNDGPALARRLAILFDLRLDISETGRIVLREKGQHKKN